MTGAIVTVEVDKAPAATVAGASGEAPIVKSAVGGGAVTVRLSEVVEWFSDPEVPVTATV